MNGVKFVGDGYTHCEGNLPSNFELRHCRCDTFSWDMNIIPPWLKLIITCQLFIDMICMLQLYYSWSLGFVH